MRISFEKIQETLLKILVNYSFKTEKAKIIARIFTESSLDGVYSHGLNRFPRFIQNVIDGIVQVDAEPEKVDAFGNMERWNGNLGPGILNASQCMARSIKLASNAGIGLVALSNTNHWMRGGTYGWQAAESGFVGICWTNTSPNMVPWGGKDPALGNNPFVMAIPRPAGHVVLDMAISQFSYGKIQNYAREGKKLPFAGGWDSNGKLTNIPEVILASERSLPIGYWKGSAFSFVLDLLAAMLAMGDPTRRIGKRKVEHGLSQVFIALNINWLNPDCLNTLITEVIENIHLNKNNKRSGAFYPGERTLKTRNENLKLGIPVEEDIWHTINKL